MTASAAPHAPGPAAQGLLDLARDTAVRAGELVRSRRAEGVEVAQTKSTDTDMVTRADQESERLIRDLIAEARPDDGFLGEESEATAGTSGLTWVVDPIDGTTNYLYDLPGYAVSIAVVEGEPRPGAWRALAASVYNPVVDELFSASAGAGAHRRGFAGSDRGERMLRLAGGADLAHALVGTGFGYDPAKRTRQAEVILSLIDRVRDIRRAGSAAIDLCSVGAGRLDAYFESGLKPWDHAAGALIARESGARVGGLHGVHADEELTIAAAPALYEALAVLLEEYGADRV